MLKNQKVIVLGGSSGMGLATARLLATEGAHVVIASRSQEKRDAALRVIGGRSEAIPLDFSQEDAVRRFFDSMGAFDHLVLMGAGLPAWGILSEIQSAALENAFHTKFWGYFLCAKYGAPLIRQSGSILFTIGGAARSAIPGTAGVAAVNGAIMCMAMTLAKELAPIRVNILSPGLVDTPAYNWMSTEEKDAFFKQMGGNLPVGRVGQPEEIAQSALYLITNAYTTGAILDVDGGGRLH
ncbi:MAG: SDR family oxidoreductase [Deltaproteobacteria bacterium]|nr:SDR family oxidoreductase [Deltaproteobacteria bacterium]